MPPIEALIRGSEKLLEIFGKWPSFHDAEVVEFNLGRGPAGIQDSVTGAPWLVAKFHLWEPTKEIDVSGYFIAKNHSLVTLRFVELANLKVEGFNHQNVIFGLTIEQKSERDSERSKFHVEFDPSFGIDAIFDCASIEVLDVTPIAFES